MDFLQSMGYSKIVRACTGSNSITGNILPHLNLEKVEQKKSGKDIIKIKNNIGMPILIKISQEHSEYRVLGVNKCEKVKTPGKNVVKIVIPLLTNDLKPRYEKGRKHTIDIELEEKKVYELSECMNGLSAENTVFYSEQKTKIKSFENDIKTKSRSLAALSQNNA